MLVINSWYFNNYFWKSSLEKTGSDGGGSEVEGASQSDTMARLRFSVVSSKTMSISNVISVSKASLESPRRKWTWQKGGGHESTAESPK